jgi:Uma2 family endonuclease
MTLWTAPEGAFTIEEFKRLPLEGRRWELLDGKVVQMEPHGLESSAVTATLLGLIGRSRSEDGPWGRFRCRV